MKVDLHIHSALSPCANDDMTPHNIVNMAKLCGLECISVCDHNTIKQQAIMAKVADELGLKYVYGIEVQSIEEVHVCCYFENENDCLEFGCWIDHHLSLIKNELQYFGNQWICNENDEFIKQEPKMLLQSVSKSLEEICGYCHMHHGIMSLAHVCDKTNSIMTQLGFIPQNLKFDCIEIKSEKQKEMILQIHPWIQNVFWLKNSDAHYLQDIGIYEDDVNQQLFEELWRKWK